MAANENPEQKVHHGALVGWTAQRIGDRVSLSLQSVTKPPPHEPDDVHAIQVLMDTNQAVQLGNFLFEMVDKAKPPRRSGSVRGWLARMFGA